jgi:putative endopeptidase
MKQFPTILICFSFWLTACNRAGERTGQTADPIDVSSHDSSVRAQDNFFLYANGGWIRNAVIPASQSAVGISSFMNDSNLARLHRILDSLAALPASPAGSDAQLAGDLYASGMDSLGIEKQGLQPAKPELDSIGAVRDFTGLIRETGRETMVNHNPFFDIGVGADDRNSQMNILHLNQGGLGLPAPDYYVNQDSAVKKIRDGYLIYIRSLFLLSGEDSAKASADAASVLALETTVAKFSKSPVELRDPEKNYHKMAVSAISSDMPGIKNLLSVMMIHTDTVVIGQPEFYRALFRLLHSTPLPVLKNYLKFHVLDDDAPYLGASFVDANFNFTKLLTGQREIRPRWKRMTTLVDKQLGDALGKLFVQQYFPPQAKARISEMVDNILATFGERLQQLDWMSDSTKAKALVKLRAIVKKVGYPDKWKDYSSIRISRTDLLGNIRTTTYYEYLRDIRKIGQPVDRGEWTMTPPTINAYYEPTANNINFPAGILAPPFFFMNGDDAVNYGAIGLVIGHEITHGFDDQGRLYDADGNLKEWWSPEDAERFKKRAENIIKQYNGYLVVDSFHLNGELTEGENIADNGGLAIAYAAFKKTAEGKSNESINGLTPDQRFFLAAAQIWKRKDRKESLRTQVKTNPHSTAMYRVNGPMSNMPAFYDAFHVQPSDSMYRPDSLRVKIW